MLTYSKIAAKGKLLISEPALLDDYFERSVVLLADHNEDGSFGVILNKPINIKLNEMIVNFPSSNIQVFMGGPVKTDNLYILHTLKQIEDSLEIIKGIYWGGNIDQIKELIIKKKIKPDTIHFYLGYSSWQPDQLNRELEENAWLVLNATVKTVFNPQPKEMWSDFLKNLGSKYAIWANQPIDPMLN